MTSVLSSICMPGDAIVEDTEVGRAHLPLGQCMLTVSNPFFFFCLGPWFVGSTTAAAPQRRFEELFSPQGQGWSKVRVVLVSPGCVCHPLGGVHGWGQDQAGRPCPAGTQDFLQQGSPQLFFFPRSWCPLSKGGRLPAVPLSPVGVVG